MIGDLAANGRLFASDQLHVASGNSAARNYSAFGSGAPMSRDMTTGGDLHVTSDLEVGGSLYAISGLIAGDVSPTTGQIFSSIGEASGQDWSEINGTSDLYVAQDLEVDGTLNVHLIVSPASSNISIDAEADARTMIDTNVSGANVASWFHDGVYSNANKVAEIQEDGDLRIRGALSESVAFDIAENFWATEPIAAGEIVAADPNLPGAVRRATIQDAGRVLGVASRRPGIVLGGAPFDEAALAASWGEAVHDRFRAESELLVAELQTRHPEHALEPPDEAVIESLALELFAEKHFVPLALAGRVRLHVDASTRPIAVGDPLGPGPLPGIAVAVQGNGPIVAIALEPLASGRSQILAFIQRGGIVASTPHGEPTMKSEAGTHGWSAILWLRCARRSRGRRSARLRPNAARSTPTRRRVRRSGSGRSRARRTGHAIPGRSSRTCRRVWDCEVSSRCDRRHDSAGRPVGHGCAPRLRGAPGGAESRHDRRKSARATPPRGGLDPGADRSALSTARSRFWGARKHATYNLGGVDRDGVHPAAGTSRSSVSHSCWRRTSLLEARCTAASTPSLLFPLRSLA